MTAIEWTDRTWNPVTGCDRTSPGCDNCYALTMAKRLKAMGQPRYQTDGDPRTSGPGFAVTCHPDVLDQPLRWRKPSTVFVNSMSDLFHPDVPYRFIRDVFNTMRCCNGQAEANGRHAPSHTFQVLTKRSQRMRDCSLNRELGYDPARPPANVWLGVSVETDRYAFRADHLRDTAAAVRFLSCEPLLGPLPSLDLTGIDWVIIGAESGHGARPMDNDWALEIVDRCQFGVPCPTCGGSGSIPAYGGAPGGQACECQYGPYVGRRPIPVFVKQLTAHPGKVTKHIDSFPEALQRREYPKAAA